jgi:hypothetical protein
MTRFPERTLIAGLLAAVIVLAAGSVARARTGFDGIWSVMIITDNGACDRAYRYPLRIANGRTSCFAISSHTRHAKPRLRHFPARFQPRRSASHRPARC